MATHPNRHYGMEGAKLQFFFHETQTLPWTTILITWSHFGRQEQERVNEAIFEGYLYDLQDTITNT
jgi:hypothetical protein